MTLSRPKALLRSLIIAYLFSAVLLLSLSFAFYRLKLGEGQINLAVFAIYAVSCLAGGFFSGKAIKNRRFFWGLLTGLLYFAVLAAASFAMGHGAPANPARLSEILLLCAAGGTVGGMLS